MGEVLHEVDFNQLKIENQQYIEKIDERNQDLLRLKLMAGNTLQVLNTHKARDKHNKFPFIRGAVVIILSTRALCQRSGYVGYLISMLAAL